MGALGKQTGPDLFFKRRTISTHNSENPSLGKTIVPVFLSGAGSHPVTQQKCATYESKLVDFACRVLGSSFLPARTSSFGEYVDGCTRPACHSYGHSVLGWLLGHRWLEASVDTPWKEANKDEHRLAFIHGSPSKTYTTAWLMVSICCFSISISLCIAFRSSFNCRMYSAPVRTRIKRFRFQKG